MSYEVTIPDAFADAFAAGTVSLMETEAGLSTTLVDASHNFVGTAGLREAPDVSAMLQHLPTGETPVVGRTTLVAIAAAAVVTIGTGTFLYVRHRRRLAKATTATTEGNRPGADLVLGEAEAVVDAELARHHQMLPGIDADASSSEFGPEARPI